MKLDTKPYEEKMKKCLESLGSQLSTMRAGRATPDVLANIKFDYYGAPTQLVTMAEVKVTDARTLVISPWDKSTMKAMEKAIQISDLGINPQNDGSVLRLVFPPLTEERRREMTKQIAKMGEDAKVAIRNIRRDANDKSKDMKKKSEMTEDECKASDKAIQDLTDKYIKEIDATIAAKSKELMTI